MSMKKAATLSGIIALTAVIGFATAACKNPTGPGSNSGTKGLVGITVTTLPAKVQYNLGENFDQKGMVVTANYDDGSAEAVTGYTLSGYDKTSAGNQLITVTYKEKTDTFTVEVIDPSKETAAKPVANPVAGAVVSGTTVALSTTTPGAEIWYTANGNIPAKNGTGSARYTTPIAITTAITIKAIAVKDGMNDSAVLEAAYTITANPGAIAVTGVTLNKTSATLTVGATETLTATVAPSNATNKNITWSSSNTDVATVSNGTITAVAVGTATITVTTTDGSKTATCAVTVDPAAATVAVTGVTLNKTATTLTVGATETFTATVTPSNATNKNITWASDNTDVATVSNGTITAVAVGTTTITVTTEDGNKTATCAVTVDPVAVTGVTLNKSAATLTVGDTETLTATVAPSNATNKNITWSSSNTAVATVSNGTITARTAGTATITVTTADGNKTAACAVTVNKADEVFSITFTADAAPLINGPTIHRSSANGPTTATLTVANPDQYSVISWHINEITTGSGAAFTLNSADAVYNRTGEHTLTVEVIKDGIPYSRAITFTVAE